MPSELHEASISVLAEHTHTYDLHPDLITVLTNRRHTYNRVVAEAKVRANYLTDVDVTGFITSCLAPLAQSVFEQGGNAKQLTSLLDIYFPLGIRALEQRLIGTSRRAPWLLELWTNVFPLLGTRLAANPNLVVDLSNAAVHIARYGERAVAGWIAGLTMHGPECGSGAELRSLGQVLAWCHGLAHYRDGALMEAARLKPELAAAVFGQQRRDDNADGATAWESVAEALRGDRWYRPGIVESTAPYLLATRGSFRGDGGLFLDPPVLLTTDQGVLTRSGESCWLMTADAFGTTWHRSLNVTDVPSVTVREVAIVEEHDSTIVEHASGQLDLGPCGYLTSVVLIDGVVALTTSRSFAVRFIGLPR
jgi:hypothetical protein